MRYAKLRGRIVERFGTISKFSEAAGISRVSVSLKLSGKVPFSKEQIEKWSELLGISMKEYGVFFFG